MYYYIHISERIYSDLCRVKRIFYRNPKPLNGHAPFFFTILDPLDKNERICSDFYALFKPILAIIVGGLNRSDWVGMLRFQQIVGGAASRSTLLDIINLLIMIVAYAIAFYAQSVGSIEISLWIFITSLVVSCFMAISATLFTVNHINDVLSRRMLYFNSNVSLFEITWKYAFNRFVVVFNNTILLFFVFASCYYYL